MELHAPDRERAMAEPHDLALGRLGRDLELRGEGRALDQQRVVARGGEALRHAAEDVGVLVQDRRGLAVHQARGADDVSAEIMAD